MNFLKYKKSISGILIILIITPIILFYGTRDVKAQFTTIEAPGPLLKAVTTSAIGSKTTAGATVDIAKIKNKELLKAVAQELLRTAAKRLLAKMTEATVNWINTGFHGAPLFVENPESFFKDIAKSEIRDLVNIIGYDNARFPFGKSSLISTIDSYKRTFAENAQYSLSKITNDPVLIQNFQQDFSVGGWDGFLLQTQFPQNNPIGFQMIYSEELARRLAGTSPTQTDIVQQTLSQGQGFLSPQKCVTNPKYNSLNNQFKKPTFKQTTPVPTLENCDALIPPADDTGFTAINQEIFACEERNKKAMYDYNLDLGSENLAWSETNSCPNKPDGSSGFERTTPGSVVAGQIVNALTSPQRQGELSQAMGNSLSAIFDALLNKLISSGLNGLTSKLNGSGNSNTASDPLDYYGNTLGSDPNTGASAGAGFNWNGPDEVVTLSTFKTEVQNAIINANKEIKLINSLDVNTPGILQNFDKIWTKTSELDMCLPGPNINFESRIDAGASEPTAAALFKDWILNKMKIELPSSTNYLNAVNSVANTNTIASEIKARESALMETLITLNSINAELSTLTSQPQPGGENEATMIRLRQRYNGILLDLSTGSTVSDIQNKLADSKDKIVSLDTLINKCAAERTVKGWINPGGENSTFQNVSTEKTVFCSTYGSVPVSCDVVFETSLAEYKQ